MVSIANIVLYEVSVLVLDCERLRLIGGDEEWWDDSEAIIVTELLCEASAKASNMLSVATQ